jgi:Phosphomethylpyrimidine kinase
MLLLLITAIFALPCCTRLFECDVECAQHTVSADPIVYGLASTEAARSVAGMATGRAPRSTTPARVLVIAGSDSGGGAGIQADIRACMANHAFAATAISALTAQNSHGVHSVHVPPVDVVEAQMVAVLEDIGADAVKTGMLPTGDIVRRVAQVCDVPCVVDCAISESDTTSQVTKHPGLKPHHRLPK